MSRVSYLESPVSCPVSVFLCLVSRVLCILSLWCLVSPVSCLVSPVWRVLRSDSLFFIHKFLGFVWGPLFGPIFGPAWLFFLARGAREGGKHGLETRPGIRPLGATK